MRNSIFFIRCMILTILLLPVAFAADMNSAQMQEVIVEMKQEMQSTIAKMQQEMNEKVTKMQQKIDMMETSISRERQQFNDNIRSMQSTLDFERENMREAAGGAPEALRSNAGNATVRIGGQLAVRYYADFNANYNDEMPGGEYANRIGWTMDTASVTFDITINEDLSMFIDVRPDKFDKAYFQWNNIAGSGLGTQVGLVGVPGGMYSSSTDMWGRVFIINPVVKEFSQAFLVDPGDASNNPGDDIKRMGAKLYYNFNDQLMLTGTIFSPSALGDTNGLLNGYDSDNSATILAPNGDPRNNGFMNCSVNLEYRPEVIDGLILSATYVGLADLGQGTYTQANRRGSSYSPQFDLGIAYLKDQFGVYLEAAYTLNPGFYSDTYNYSMSLGADYKITDKLRVAGGAEYGLFASSSNLYKSTVEPAQFAPDYPNFFSSAVRLRVGLRYDFANGVWLKGEYGHVISNASGMGDSSLKGANKFTFETGLCF